MNPNSSNTALIKIQEYQKKGYTASYQMGEDGLKDLETNKEYKAEEVIIEDEFRYEGMSNPDDNSMLYILKMQDNSKGTILVPYGASADGTLAWFLKDVSQNKHNRDKTKLNKVS